MVTDTPAASPSAGNLTDLLDRAEAYLPEPELGRIRKAYEFAAAAHEGQFRRTGEPYVIHPLSAATVVAELRMDSDAIIAALLHDVVEDCGVDGEEIARKFGKDVRRLVDGVTKLGRLKVLQPGASDRPISPPDENDPQAENLRKMFVAMAEDIRVVLIKLSDRLHNMRTLYALAPDRQKAIAKETIEIYAPLAHRLGIWQIEWELEDLAFRYLDPVNYERVESLVAAQRESQEKYIENVVAVLREELAKTSLEVDITGRRKHLYSVFNKLEKYSAQGKDFFQIHDLLAVRILVDSVQDCYAVLGAVHGLWRPISGEFDDYIASPRDSGYQSLHTTVMCIGGRPLEIQIRTQEMHQVAEFGLAAHWRYKEGGRKDDKFDEGLSWIRQLMEWHHDMTGAREFVESIKTDIFEDQVFVFTPKGDVKDLPAGATPLDFAYRIHTDVGHRCIGAKVNGKLVSLDYELQNGDAVYVLSSKSAKGPSLDWLNPSVGYVKTVAARQKVRQWFRKQARTENVARGKELLDKELKRLALREGETEIARLLDFKTVDDLRSALGSGDIAVQQMASRIALERQKAAELADPVVSPVAQSPSDVTGAVEVLGVGDLLTRMGHCCNPVPGDSIVGYITRSRGVTVHRSDCKNIGADSADRLVDVSWGGSSQRAFPVPVIIEAWDRIGMLRDITTVVSGERVNMRSLNVATRDDDMATIEVLIETQGLRQLSHVLSKIEGIRGVVSVTRGGDAAPRREAASG